MTKQPQQNFSKIPLFEAEAVSGAQLSAQKIVSDQREWSILRQPVTLGSSLSIAEQECCDELRRASAVSVFGIRNECPPVTWRAWSSISDYVANNNVKVPPPRAEAKGGKRSWKKSSGRRAHDRAVVHTAKVKKSRQADLDRKVDLQCDDFSRPPSWVSKQGGVSSTPVAGEMDSDFEVEYNKSPPSRVDESVDSVDSSEMIINSLVEAYPPIKLLIDQFRNLASVVGAPPDWLVSLLLLLDSLQTATGPRQVLNALISYFTRLGSPSDTLLGIWDCLSSLLSEIVLPQGAESVPFSFFGAVVQHFQSAGVTSSASALWSKLTELYGLVAVTSVFVGIFRLVVPEQVSARLKALPISLGDFDGVFTCIVGLIKECALALVDWASGKPHVWFKGNSFSQYVRLADELIVDELDRSEFMVDPVLKRVKATAYLSDLTECIASGDVLSSVLGGSMLCKVVADKQKSLKTILSRLKFTLEKLSRAARPFIVGLSGPPGLGKSIFGSAVLDEMADARGLFLPGQPRDSTPFTWFPASAKFADGFNGKKLVMIDDMGARGRKDEATVEEVMRLLRFGGNIPTVMNMADLADKGRHYSDVYGVVITSNEADFGFGSIPNPGAAIRRVNLYIKLDVKPQYAMSGNPRAVDSSKVGLDERLKVWNITIHTYSSIPIHPFASIDGPVVLQTSNTAEAMRFIRSAVDKQLKSELSQLRAMERKSDERLCSVGVRWDYHDRECCKECDYALVHPQGFGSWSNSAGFRFLGFDRSPLPGVVGPDQEGRGLGWPTKAFLTATRVLSTTSVLISRVGQRVFPPPPVPVELAACEWTDHLRGGRLLAAADALKMDFFGSFAYYTFAFVLCLVSSSWFAAMFSISGLALAREIVYGSYAGDWRLKRITWVDVRHALLAIWIQCDFFESVFLTAVLMTASSDRYTELLSYLWRRPTVSRLRVVNVVALVAGLGAVVAIGRWWSHRPKTIVSQGADLSTAWLPKKTSPWMNAISYYHDSTPGAIHQIPKGSGSQAVESRCGIMRCPDGVWSNIFAVSGDVYLMTTHMVPKLPCIVEIFHNSRRQHRLEPVKFELTDSLVHHMGDEHSLVRLVGIKGVPSIVSLFQSQHCVTYGFEVKCSERTPTSEPVTHDYTGYKMARGRFAHNGEVVVVNGASAAGKAVDGMCGSPVYTLEPRLIVLGIHYGGVGDVAFSTRLSAERLAGGLEALRAKSLIPFMPVIPQGFYTSLAHDPASVQIAPHPKSAFNNEPLEVDFLFCERSGSANPGTDVCLTEMSGCFSWLGEEVGLNLTQPVMAPFLSGATWLDPGSVFLRGLTHDKPFCYSEWRQQLDDLLEMVGDVPHCRPLSDFQALNGTGGRGGLIKLNLQTASGGHWGCKKTALFTRSPDGVIEALPPVFNAWKQRVKEASSGEMAKNFFSCVPKDEPVSVEKASTANTRYIQVADVSYALAIRQFASLPLMQALATIPEVAVGMNCYSPEGSAWVERMRSSSGHDMDADIRRLDRSFGAADFLLCIAFSLEVARRAGYTKDELATLNNLLFGLLHAVFCLRGSYFVADSLNASGHPLTVLWNSVICLSLYLRWFRRSHGSFSVSSFRRLMTLSVYGDDGAVNCPKAWTFDSLVASFLRDGFVATPGRKDAATGVVNDVTELTFLKRSPRFHRGLDCWVMALSKKSIAKMITWKVRSKWISPIDQECAMLTNALWEAFLWEDDLLPNLIRTAPAYNISIVVRPTLSGVINRFGSGEIEGEDPLIVDAIDVNPNGAVTLPLVLSAGRIKKPTLSSICVTQSSDLTPLVRALREREPIPPLLGAPYSGERCGKRTRGVGTSGYRCCPLGVKESSASLPTFNDQVQSSSTSMDTASTGPRESQPAAGMMMGSAMSSGAQLQFLDAAPTSTMASAPPFEADPDLCLPAPEAAPYLSRPVLIHSMDWTAGTTAAAIDPISLWANTAQVREKMVGYVGLRGALKLRVVLNGTQMSYGRLMFALDPMPAFHSTFAGSATNPLPYELVNYSQMRNVVMDPACNESMELSLPFIGRSEFYPLIATGGLDYDTGPICRLAILPLVPLATVATTADPVSVRIYAWFEDVKVVSSGFVTWVSPHGKKKDESSPGVISRISGVAAGASAALADILPSMAPMFRTAQVFANTVGAIAGALGFSLPTQLEPPHFARVKNTNHLPHSLGLDMSTKLSLDPSCQVSVDSRIVDGSLSDDMMLSAIACRPSYLGQWSWTGALPTDSAFVLIPVTPAYALRSVLGAFVNYAFSAAGFAASGFKLWRGDIIYDIDVVASKFHSGRLRISWVPPTGFSSTSTISLMNYSWILDLATQRKVRIRVPYVGPAAFRYVDFATLPSDAGRNGTLVIAPETKLISPGTVDSATIVVYMSGAENIEFAMPDDTFISRFSFSLTAPAGFAALPDEEGVVDVKPQGSRLTDVCDTVEVCLGPPTGVRDLTPIYFGERINSLRQLVKRSVLYMEGNAFTFPAVNSYNYYGILQLPAYPYPPGFAEFSQYWTHMAWYGLGFLGVRGGVRWRATMSKPSGSGYVPSVAGRRYNTALTYIASMMTFVYATAGGIPFMTGSWNGQNEAGENQFQDVELPYACTYKYLPAPFPNKSNRAAGIGPSGTAPGGVDIRFGPIVPNSTAAGVRNDMQYTVYVAAAEDFSYTWFVCGPVVQAAF